MLHVGTALVRFTLQACFVLNHLWTDHTVEVYKQVTRLIVVVLKVMKFAANTGASPSLVLGRRFEPGRDTRHFCQPTDVAVMKDGSIYVADGSVFMFQLLLSEICSVMLSALLMHVGVL